MDALTAAGMREQGLLNVVDAGTVPVSSVGEIADPAHPCVGAVEVKHSHFFTAGGSFGSRDANGRQVDDGTWAIVDADTLEISGVRFGFAIDGDELRLEPIAVGTCPDSTEYCEEAWKVMVAMPGMAWTRGGG
jgi:hypothetical protein